MLEIVQEDGTIPKKRLSDAITARSILNELVERDSESGAQRAEMMAIIDGAPPYTEADLKKVGNRDRSNVNWGGARARINDALSPYFELIASPETIVNARVLEGDVIQRQEWAGIIAEEVHRTVMGWGGNKAGFIHNEIFCAQNMVIHGIGAVHWETRTDFRYKALKRRNIFASRSAPSDITEITELFVRDTMSASKLYGYIRDKSVARAVGWDHDSVMSVLKRHHRDRDRFPNHEELEELFQNNSMRWDRVDARPVPVVHCYIVEYSGMVSHMIACEDGDEGFLYAGYEEFDAIHQTLWMCFAGVGNGDFYSVRGLGTDAAQFGRAQNFLKNSLIDNSIAGSTLWWTAASPEDIAKVAAIQVAHGRVLPEAFKPQQISTGAAINSTLTVSQALSMDEANQTGAYRAQSLAPRGVERTATEVESEVGDRGRLTSVKVEHYLAQKDIHWKEVYRRLALIPIARGDAGYPQARLFRERCEQRGVPREIMNQVEITAARSVGNGSASDRRVRYNRMSGMMHMMPEGKRDVFARDFIASEGGSREWADRYGPDPIANVPGIDQSIAILENNSFATGGMQDPFSMDNKHAIHLPAHYEYAQALMQQVQEGGAAPSAIAPILGKLWAHMSSHAKAMSQDPTRIEEAKNWETAVGGLNNAMKQIERMAEQEQEMQSDQQRPEPELLKAQAEIQIMQQKATVENQIAVQKAQQEMALKDAQTAANLRNKNTNTQ